MEATLTLVVTTRMLILWLIDSGDKLEEDKTIAGSKSIEFFYATDKSQRAGSILCIVILYLKP